ncbi:Brix-domain-containing protein [Pavlovales sp. CCMP2436]|nr:Brix-domain-containing protein [Pavlovales sp. CCMP2436]
MSAAKILARKRSRQTGVAEEYPAPASVLRKVPHARRSKVLALISHGSTSKFTALMEDWVSLLPHVRKDCKLEQKDRIDTIPEIAELAGCNRALFFEVRKHSDLYLWAGSVAAGGPSVKFLVNSVHSMDELSLTGNCLRGSRGIVSFDGAFGEDAAPHLRMVRQILTGIFAVPEGHPKSKPFVDHVHSFTLDGQGKVHYRHYQLSAAPAEAGVLAPKKGKPVQMLVEIGPRCTLTVMRIFAGAFGGPTLFANPAFVSPNHVRAEVRRQTGERYAKKVTARAAMRKRRAGPERQMPHDELGDVFR